MFPVEALIQEFKFKAIRSSGSGGQHVNKVSSKVELTFDIPSSQVLRLPQKERLLKKLDHRLSKAGILVIQCDESRSQHSNKSIIIKRAVRLLETALVVQKKRRPTKIPKAVIRKRIKNKRLHSERKKQRKKPDLD